MKNNKIITLVKMTVQSEFMDAALVHAREARQISTPLNAFKRHPNKSAPISPEAPY